MSRSRRRPMSRFAPNELATKPCRSKAARQLRTNSSETIGIGGQHLRGDDLDPRADAELGDAVEQPVEVVPPGPELALAE